MTEATHSETLDRARRVRLVLLDADGVLTDGRIVMTARGDEARSFYSRDGVGIRLGQRAAIGFGVVSGRTSSVVESRATELGFVVIRQGVEDKAAAVREVASGLGWTLAEVCFVGDDIVDLPAMRIAGLAAAPGDADPAVLRAAHFVTSCAGGRGAVREVVDFLLRAQGSWDEVTRPYFESRG